MNVSQDEVLGQASTEMSKIFRAAAQIGRFLADQRREALRHAQIASERQRQALADAIETERRLAEPVYRRALESTFWDKTDPEEAAWTYGLATRFQTIDPMADAAARRCEAEAAKRWDAHLARGESLAPAAEPATASDIDAATLDTVAPALDGEQRQWADVLQESADASRAESAGDGHTQAERQAEATMSVLATALDEHPEVTTVRGTREDQSVSLTALDEAGKEVREASQDLNEVVQASTTPSLVASRLAGRAFTREEFTQAASSPLMRAATRPRPQDEAPKDSQENATNETPTTPWDSPQARKTWADKQRAHGHDPRAVRAATTADNALHEPATNATRRTKTGTASGRRRPANRHGRTRKNTL